MQSFRIGLDTTALPARPVGAGRYIVNLARALATMVDAPYSLTIFAQPHGRALIEAASWPVSNGNVTWEMVGPFGTAHRLVWEQIGLPAAAKRLKLDLLHSPHYTRPFWLPCRSIVTIHDMTFFLMPHLHTKVKRMFFPTMIRYSVHTADGLLAASESTRRDAIRLLGSKAERMKVTPLGVDGGFHPIADSELCTAVRQRYSLPQDFILYVGALEPRKNLSMLLRAFARARQKGLNLPLVLAGRRGWMFEDIFEHIERLGLQKLVILPGYVAQEDLPVVYNLASMFVYPTLYEGFGLPVLEAMACGTPVITTAVSSMPEFVGSAGILLPTGDEDALVEALADLAGDAERRAFLAEAGPRQAAVFTWERTARLTLDAYRDLLEHG